MDALTLTLLKLWKPNTNKKPTTKFFDNTETETVTDQFTVFNDSDNDGNFSDVDCTFTDSDDDDDSFFELELSNFKERECIPSSTNNNNTPKPQSPISILRSNVLPSSPKLRFLTKLTKKQKPRNENTINNNGSNNVFTIKFLIEDGKFRRSTSRSSSSSTISPRSSSEESNNYESSKRFSKENVQKYFRAMNPLKVKRESGVRSGITSPARSFSSSASCGLSSPRKKDESKKQERERSRFDKVVNVNNKKKLSKCNSSPASFPVRSEGSSGGGDIEDAILHCKLSSKGKSTLSRCSSDTSNDKSMQKSEESL